MALNARVISFALNTGTGNQAVTGLNFTPTVVIVMGNLLTASGTGAQADFWFGVGLSSTSRRAVGGRMGSDVATNTDVGIRTETDRIIGRVTQTGNETGAADFVSMDADGFTINITDAPASAVICLALCFGGDARGVLGTITVPGATGNQTTSGLAIDPTCLLLFTFAAGSATDFLGVGNSNFVLGAGVSSSARWYSVARMVDAQATSVSRRQQKTAGIFATLSNTAAFNEADLVSLGVGQFVLNWTAVPRVGDTLQYLAMSGVDARVGSFNENTVAGAQAITGLGVAPRALLLQSVNAATSSANQSAARRSLGIGTGPTERGTIWYGGEDAVASASATANHSLNTGKILEMLTEGTPTLNDSIDLTSLDSDGFTLDITTASGTAKEILYLAFGSIDVPTPLRRKPEFHVMAGL